MRVILPVVIGDFVRSGDVGYEELRFLDEFGVDPINRAEPKAVASLRDVPSTNGSIVFCKVLGELRILGEIHPAAVCPERIDHIPTAPVDATLTDVRSHNQRN